MRILGIDTDKHGALCVIDTSTCLLHIYHLPVFEWELESGKMRGCVDGVVLYKGLMELQAAIGDIDVAILEAQRAWAKDGAASMFTFGMTYASCLTAVGLATNSPNFTKLLTVSGDKWKAKMNLSSDKSLSVSLASRLFPECVSAWKLAKHVSSAEAALIAVYGASVSGVRFSGLREPYRLGDIDNKHLIRGGVKKTSAGQSKKSEETRKAKMRSKKGRL